jgi:probable F420-dependent oxidoreductase
MNIGVVFPQTEFGNDPGAIRAYAQTAEALGYTHILAYDHVLGANPERPGGWHGPYTYQTPFHEPFVLFGFMAGVTTTIGFCTGIIILPQRQTALVAKQAAALDVLSGGRLRLGVGLGWNAVEYQALGMDFKTRGARIEEQVRVMQRLWTEPLVTIDTDQHQIADAGLNPLPVQRPIPVWFGGHSDQQLARAARVGQGWLPNARTPEDARPLLEALDRHLAAHGRSRAGFGLEPRLPYRPELWDSLIAGWRAAGATHLTLNTMGAGFTTSEAHIVAIRRFAEQIKRSTDYADDTDDTAR